MSRNPMPVILIDWKPMPRNTLRGFATITIGALKITDVAIHRSSPDRAWAQLPAKPQINPDGTVRKDDKGKIQYVPVISWLTRESADRFSEATIAAVEDKFPNATQ